MTQTNYSTRSPFVPLLSRHAQSGRWSSFGKRVWFTEPHLVLVIFFFNYVLYVFFWVFPRRPIVICRRFGTLYQFHLQRLNVKYEVYFLPSSRAGCKVWSILHTLHPALGCKVWSILHTLHPALEDGNDRGFRNVGKPQSDTGEIPKRIHTRFKTRQKFEIKNTYVLFTHFILDIR